MVKDNSILLLIIIIVIMSCNQVADSTEQNKGVYENQNGYCKMLDLYEEKCFNPDSRTKNLILRLQLVQLFNGTKFIRLEDSVKTIKQSTANLEYPYFLVKKSKFDNTINQELLEEIVKEMDDKLPDSLNYKIEKFPYLTLEIVNEKTYIKKFKAEIDSSMLLKEKIEKIFGDIDLDLKCQ